MRRDTTDTGAPLMAARLGTALAALAVVITSKTSPLPKST
jgi:hypothetical protein